jgi:hypothetical protein
MRLTTGALVLALAAVAFALVPRLTTPPPEAAGEAAPADAAVEAEQRTLLVVLAPEDGAATTVTLLAAPAVPGDEGAIVFLPVGTLLGIPGHGLDRLGNAQRYGGAPLAEATVENALGIAVDHSAVLSESALAAFLHRVGPLELDVPERLVARNEEGEASLRFAEGEQTLDGPRLAEYWAFLARGEEELAGFPRQRLVWEALLAALERPAALDALVRDGAPQLETSADEEWLRELFEALAAAAEADRLETALLPVEPFGTADDEGAATYRLRAEEARTLVAELLAASRAEEPSGQVARVEVLNGVGTPGIGQAVHDRLEGEGFRIVRTDNARSFDFEETRILVYDEARLPDARRLRDLLGVGSIAVSRRPQSVVDLTVVVGADFLDTEGQEP